MSNSEFVVRVTQESELQEQVIQQASLKELIIQADEAIRDRESDRTRKQLQKIQSDRL